MNWPILSIVIWLPIFGGIAVMLLGSERTQLGKQVALGVSIVTFALSVPLWTSFDSASAAMQFVENVPWIPRFGALYGLGVQETNRADLVAVLLTGVPGLNFSGPTQADMLRINLTIAPTAAVGAGNRLGVVGGDLAGWPNGRRLEDDVVDIAERAVGGVLIGKNLPLGDGVNANDIPFSTTFPYVAEAPSGFDDPKGEPKPLPSIGCSSSLVSNCEMP